MTDEQGRVLDLVSEGKISVDEAERLLSALAGSSDAEAADPHLGLGDALNREIVSVVVEDGKEPAGGSKRDETLTVGASPRVIVKNTNGRVKCEVGDEGSVRVSATLKSPRSVKYSVTQEGDVVTVEVKRKSSGKASLLGFFGLRVGADIVVAAPRMTEIDIGAGNGVVEESGFEGASTVKLSNGRIMLQDMKGGVDVVATNGKISLGACEGDLTVRTTNGWITVEDARGSITASTVNGSVAFGGELVPESSSSLKAVNGPVSVKLLGEPSLRVVATCFNGSLKSDFPGLELITVKKVRKLVGILGEGAAELEVRSVNGAVSIT